MITPFLKEHLKYTLNGKKILLGISGSIAAFKSCDTIRFLKECGASVRVVLTQGAENFVTRTTLETLSGSPVLTGFWDSPTHELGTHHIATARWADLILVAPATAQCIAKIAHGLADDLLSTEILAFQGPLFIAPAMNPSMLNNVAVQENLSRLKSRGIKLLGPNYGHTACGEEGTGRMIEPLECVEKIAEAFFLPQRGQQVLITLGPTRSAIDPIRFVSNRSSGQMGISLCWAALQNGYSVSAICGLLDTTLSQALPKAIEKITVHTTQEMERATLSRWPQADVFISAAAVLDWDIENPSPSKLKKENGVPRLTLQRSPDILSSVSRLKKDHQYVLGFAAETQDPVTYGFDKLMSKGCDALFANDVSSQEQGIDSPYNGGWWLAPPDRMIALPRAHKSELARTLISMLPQNAQALPSDCL